MDALNRAGKLAFTCQSVNERLLHDSIQKAGQYIRPPKILSDSIPTCHLELETSKNTHRMPKRKWYVVIVGRDIGVFSTWYELFGLAFIGIIHSTFRLEVGPLVKGVPNAVHQSFLTRAEATRMFTEQQAKGTTRIVDPEREEGFSPNQPQRVRNYSAPAPRPQSRPPTTSTFAMSIDPLSAHPTIWNRSSNSTPSPVLLSDRRAPVASRTSPTSWNSNPSSGSDISPSMRRLQIIQDALEQANSSPINSTRSQGQLSPAGRRPVLFNRDIVTSSSQSLTGPSLSKPRAPQRPATASPDVFRSPKTYSPANTSKVRESASAFVGFEARAPSSTSGHQSHNNTNVYTANRVTSAHGARIPNPTAESFSRPSSSSRGLQKTLSHTSDTFQRSSELATSSHSYVPPVRAVIRTPKWLAPYPTARTPSPDSDSSSQTRECTESSESSELLSPLSNVNLNSFTLDNHPCRGSSMVERSISPTHPSPRKLNAQSQSPSIFSNGTPHHSPFSSTPTCSSSRSIQARSRRFEITHDSDPRSPILNRQKIPMLDERSLFPF